MLCFIQIKNNTKLFHCQQINLIEKFFFTHKRTIPIISSTALSSSEKRDYPFVKRISKETEVNVSVSVSAVMPQGPLFGRN